MSYTIRVNGTEHTVQAEGDTPLRWVLRELLDMPGTKYGCGSGLCGACAVHVNGALMLSCALPLEAMVGLQVCKAHLNPLPLVTRPGERLGLHLPASHLAGIFVKIARDLARRIPGAASRPQRTETAQSRFEAR